MTKNGGTTRPLWFVAFVAALLAWCVPGVGHIYLGRVRRGVILFIAIAAVFWAGVAVGGVMTVDSRYDRWWFYAQTLTGVHGLVGWYRQEQVYKDVARQLGVRRIVPSPGGRPTEEQMRIDDSLQSRGNALVNPTEGVARAYSGVAGLLNLLCIFDVVLLALMGQAAEPRRRRNTPGRSEGAAT